MKPSISAASVLASHSRYLNTMVCPGTFTTKKNLAETNRSPLAKRYTRTSLLPLRFPPPLSCFTDSATTALDSFLSLRFFPLCQEEEEEEGEPVIFYRE